MASLLMDMMEYANDALAHAAYVVSATDLEINRTDGSVIYTDILPSYPASRAFDGTTNRTCVSGVVGVGDTNNTTIGKDWGNSVTHSISKAIVYGSNDHGFNWFVSSYTLTLEGSNDGSNWTELGHVDFTDTADEHTGRTITPTIFTFYRYHHIKFTNNGSPIYDQYCAQIKFYELPLQCYSEATIKTQGSYSLKIYATITDSLSETLTKTISPTFDLTGVLNIQYDIYTSRTGSNIKIGLHDGDGTTTEITSNVIVANTWQTVSWDLSGVSDANKDNIDSIIITIVNADAANTIYIDNFKIAQAIDIFGIIG